MKTISLWADVDLDENQEPSYIEYSKPSLAYVLSLLENGKEIYEIFNLMSSVTYFNEYEVNEEHISQAEKIYQYFSYKHLMRRLKGEHISPYMVKVDRICESPFKVNKKYLQVLTTLPTIYKQNLELDSLYLKYNSCDTRINLDNDVLTFIKSVTIRTKGSDQKHYFWHNKQNQLVRIISNVNENSISAWNAISKLKNIKVTDKSCSITPVQGYRFSVINPSEKMSIEIMENNSAC